MKKKKTFLRPLKVETSPFLKVPEGGHLSLPEAPEGGDDSTEESPLSQQSLVAYVTLEGGLSLITFGMFQHHMIFMNKECFNLEEAAIGQEGEEMQMKLTTNHH